MAKVIVAPDSFKGSLTAAGIAEAIAKGWLEQRPEDELTLLPLADGGEGTLDAIAIAYPEATRMPLEVTGPHGRAVQTEWLLLPATPGRDHSIGVVELANTSGIELLDNELLPFDAHTLGFGEAICAALDHGIDELIVGIGSSASTDGGTGMLRALGANFFDARGEPVALGAAGLHAIESVNFSGLRPMPSLGVTVLSDVTAPLTGPSGAAAVFGPQKGFKPEDTSEVDEALQRYAALTQLALKVAADATGTADATDAISSVASAFTSSRDVNGLADVAGAGAAGGTGFGLLVWGATLVPGATYIADLLNLAVHCAEADLVITGEGKFDAQSLLGKVAGMVLEMAEAANTPVALIAGHISTPGHDSEAGSSKPPLARFADAVALTSLAPSVEAALASPAKYVREAASQMAERCNG